MILKTQINLIVFSFLYGLFLNFTLNLCENFIYNKRIILKIVCTIIYVFSNVLIYFIFLEFINNGVIHYYSFLSMIFGMCIQNIFRKKNKI